MWDGPKTVGGYLLAVTSVGQIRCTYRKIIQDPLRWRQSRGVHCIGRACAHVPCRGRGNIDKGRYHRTASLLAKNIPSHVRRSYMETGSQTFLRRL